MWEIWAKKISDYRILIKMLDNIVHGLVVNLVWFIITKELYDNWIIKIKWWYQASIQFGTRFVWRKDYMALSKITTFPLLGTNKGSASYLCSQSNLLSNAGRRQVKNSNGCHRRANIQSSVHIYLKRIKVQITQKEWLQVDTWRSMLKMV